jgi:ATP-dependent Clp protease ATP-binding subunit ClpC
VVLLDEIEKAHPDVFNILLQVLDEGRLTDNYGRVIDFKNAVVIMTSNVGARDITSSSKVGFETSEDDELDYDRIKERVKEEIDRTFAPEFLNRLDDTIVFHPLSREQIGMIVYILLRDIEKRLGEENLAIRLTEEAVTFLVNVGYDTKFGARPLKRSIQRYIEDPLSEKILMAEFTPGDEIEVLLADDEESLRFRAASQASAT